MKKPFVCIPLQDTAERTSELFTVLRSQLAKEFYSGEHFKYGNDLLRRVVNSGTTETVTQLINWVLQNPRTVRLAYRVHGEHVLFWLQYSKVPTHDREQNAAVFREFIKETAPSTVYTTLSPYVCVRSFNHSAKLLGITVQ